MEGVFAGHEIDAAELEQMRMDIPPQGQVVPDSAKHQLTGPVSPSSLVFGDTTYMDEEFEFEPDGYFQAFYPR
jgi:hypothetical protein